MSRAFTQTYLRELERNARAECQPIMAEMARVHATSIRPMFIRDGRIEYAPYATEIQAYLDALLAMAQAIVEKYKGLAESGPQESQ